MKYAVIIPDGLADRKIAGLGNKTPVEAARTPNMDMLARKGTIGMVRTIPAGLPPGSDVANMSIMGYDPAKLYTGRAPFEAASIGVELKDDDVAFRCNLVTLSFDRERTRAFMEDHSSGHITTAEASGIMKDIQAEFGTSAIRFHPGVSYRHLMVWAGGNPAMECTPPHDIIGKDITDYQPVGKGEEVLREIMHKSVAVLEHHPINKKRISEGKRPANSLWFWGQGKKPKLNSFREKYGISGALVSAVDLTKGLGMYAGLEILSVPGATGYLDTNYKGKAEYSIEALEKHDFVYIHIEAPDEAGHSGKTADKVKAIEDIDEMVIGPVLEGLRKFGDFRIMVLPDHATPIELRTHSDEPVPFVIYDSASEKDNKGASFSEEIGRRSDALIVQNGHELMDLFIRGRIK